MPVFGRPGGGDKKKRDPGSQDPKILQVCDRPRLSYNSYILVLTDSSFVKKSSKHYLSYTIRVKDLLFLEIFHLRTPLLYSCTYQCYSTAKYVLQLDEQTLRW